MKKETMNNELTRKEKEREKNSADCTYKALEVNFFFKGFECVFLIFFSS